MFKVYAQQSAVCEDRPVPRCFSLSLGTVFRFSHNYDGPVRPCRPQKVGEICPLVEKSQLVETQNGTGEGAHARQHRLRNRRRGPARLAAVGAAQRSDTGTGQQRFIAVTAGPNRFLPAGQKTLLRRRQGVRQSVPHARMHPFRVQGAGPDGHQRGTVRRLLQLRLRQVRPGDQHPGREGVGEHVFGDR
uniref:(northern house mosquito) hypothetical protein n=1 Tax=Culex pipiens TaxID=7175 RepID=A0A8D8DB13_CULPI